MFDQRAIDSAAQVLLHAAPQGSRVILFGSYATGKAQAGSDLDFLVIEPEVPDRMSEIERLSSLLGSLLIPADVVVVSQAAFERLRDTPNSLACLASREGKVYECVA